MSREKTLTAVLSLAATMLCACGKPVADTPAPPADNGSMAAQDSNAAATNEATSPQVANQVAPNAAR